MFEKLIVAMKVPDSVEKDYWKQTVRANRKILVLLASVTTLAQLFNIYRIFFVSESKLGTLNNCIYFFFYCSKMCIRDSMEGKRLLDIFKIVIPAEKNNRHIRVKAPRLCGKGKAVDKRHTDVCE